MAGKRQATHWAARRKQKQARTADNEHRKPETIDRRAGLADTIHPGSYAALRTTTSEAETGAEKNANEDDPKAPPKRRYGLWLAFCGKNYSGMQMFVLYAPLGGHKSTTGELTTHRVIQPGTRASRPSRPRSSARSLRPAASRRQTLASSRRSAGAVRPGPTRACTRLGRCSLRSSTLATTSQRS